MRTVAAPRPPRLYSVLSTTIGSLPCMMTLPARISCASFMAWFLREKSRRDMDSWVPARVSPGAARTRQGRGVDHRHSVPVATCAKPTILAGWPSLPATNRHNCVTSSSWASRRSRCSRCQAAQAASSGTCAGPSDKPFQRWCACAHVVRQGLGRAVQVEVEKGVELGRMRAVVLRVDLPQQRGRRPQGAHERVLTPHGVQVAAPQQPVVVGPGSATAVRSPAASRAAPARAAGRWPGPAWPTAGWARSARAGSQAGRAVGHSRTG
jgi:hypothetical protein